MNLKDKCSPPPNGIVQNTHPSYMGTLIQHQRRMAMNVLEMEVQNQKLSLLVLLLH